MYIRKIEYCSLVKGRTVITLNEKIDLLDIHSDIVRINGKDHRFSLTHNEYIIVLDSDNIFETGETAVFDHE